MENCTSQCIPVIPEVVPPKPHNSNRFIPIPLPIPLFGGGNGTVAGNPPSSPPVIITVPPSLPPSVPVPFDMDSATIVTSPILFGVFVYAVIWRRNK